MYSVKTEKREAGLLRVSEVATMIGKSPDTVLRWSRTGKLPSTFQLDGWHYFLQAELEEWLQEPPKATQDDQEATKGKG